MPSFRFRKNDKLSDDSSPAKSPNKFSAAFSTLKSQGKNRLTALVSTKSTRGSRRLRRESRLVYHSAEMSMYSEISAVSDGKEASVMSEESLKECANAQEHQPEQEAPEEPPIPDRRTSLARQNSSSSSIWPRFGMDSMSSVFSVQTEGDASVIQPQHAQLLLSRPALRKSERSAPLNGAVSLEAHMSLKYSKATGLPTKWFNAYVILSMDTVDRGAIRIYANKPRDEEQEVRLSTRVLSTDLAFVDEKTLMEIPAEMNWVAKDYDSSSRRFVIEIPSDAAKMLRSSANLARSIYLKSDATEKTMGDAMSTDSESLDLDNATPFKDSSSSLLDALEKARSKNEPFRLKFRCLRKGGKEKQVWIDAFEELGRLSFDTHKRVFDFGKKVRENVAKKNERIRVKRDEKFAKQSLALQLSSRIVGGSTSSLFDSDRPAPSTFRLTNKTDNREFQVCPSYAYPNKWMTHTELYNEMLKPSLVYHDLRTATESRKEIGTFRVELLECSGLPALDWNTPTNAVVYFVCGSYAFTSDVIANKVNPVWLPRSRRACIFPLFHAYSKVYAGVFEDGGPGQKDNFAGRVVLDLAKCRPGSTYDMALPLRLSSHVYSRRARGVIRLRFSIDYTSYRAAILSYLPGLKFNDPDKENSVSVLCYDEKAFRNIALTVHGKDLPGKFGSKLLKATTRELQFIKKVTQNTVRDAILDIIFWKNRVFSGLCFLAWMHCCYLNSFGLAPFYFCCFWHLVMLQNYALYGSDGPVSQGFVPPSLEEMAMALGGGKPIEPLYVRPHRDEASALKNEEIVKTYSQKAKILLDALGFKPYTEEDQPEDYHIEFPLSRGIRHPITEEYLYPKFSIDEAKVVKKSDLKAKNEDEDDRWFSIDILNGQQLASWLETAAGDIQAWLHDTSKPDAETDAAFERLPKVHQIQNQNIDVPELAEKKKIIEDLQEIRDEIHSDLQGLFLDKTHKIVQKDPVYFGGKQSADCNNELEKLLGLGTYATSVPVKSMIAVHMAPLLTTIQGPIHAFRSFVNIATWQDPIMSFWVMLAIDFSALVFLIFPFRRFFVFVGIVLLGPQNWLFIKYVKPQFREELNARRHAKRKKKMDAAKKKVYRDIPTDQPIISSHTSDNSPPLELSLDEVDKRGIHQVCVPYSQLTYRRDIYWPPQPEYGSCDPDVRGFERSMQRMEALSARKSTIGLPTHIQNSTSSKRSNKSSKDLSSVRES